MAELKIGTLIDRAHAKREKIRDMEKKINAEKSLLNSLQEEIILRLKKDKLESSGGKTATVSISEQEVPSVIDWPKFYAYVRKNNAFDMLQKRVSTSAYKQRLEAGKKVPGLKTFTVTKLNMSTKRSKK